MSFGASHFEDVTLYIAINSLLWPKVLIARLTLHFKNKKLSTNSSRDFNSVLDTINQYWIDPGKYFCPKSSYLSAIYESFKSKVLKVVKSKNGHHFY